MVTRLKTKKEMKQDGDDLEFYGSMYVIVPPYLKDELDSDQENWKRYPETENKKKKHFWNW